MKRMFLLSLVTLLLIVAIPPGFTQTLGEWTSLTSLPSPRYDCSAVLIDTTVYILGGSHFSSSTPYPILRTGILPDGTLSGWVEESCRPLEIHGAMAVSFAHGGYLYLMSGAKGVTDTISTTMERALINSDGSIGTWQVVGYTPVLFYESTWLQTSTDLYVFGGYPGTQEIWRLPLYDNGSIGTFSRLSSDYNIARYGSGVVLIGDRLFIQGGANVYGPGQPEYTETAILFSDGNIGEWTILSKSNFNHWTHLLARVGGDLYTIAGVLPGDDIRGAESAPFLTDSTLGEWSMGAPRPHQRIKFGHIQTQKGLYVFGGWGNHDLDGVEFAPIIYSTEVKSPQWKGYE